MTPRYKTARLEASDRRERIFFFVSVAMPTICGFTRIDARRPGWPRQKIGAQTGRGAIPRQQRVLSEQRQLSCEQHSSPNPKLQLRRKGTPLRQRSRASLLVDFAADEMALLIEVVVDLGMN